MNYYPFHIGDYLSATRHLSWEEDAAFRRLLDTYYTTEKPLPLDHRAVCRLVLATTDSQREAVQVVLDEFFEQTPEGWINRRADAEIATMREKQAKQRAKANKRWGKPVTEPGNAPAMPRHDETDAAASKTDADAMPPTPTPTPTERAKEKKGRSAPIELPDCIPPEVWADWHGFRNGMKGWTPKARELSLGKLAKLAAQGHAPRAVVDQSIERGWTGLFPPRDDFAPRGPPAAVNGATSKYGKAIEDLERMKTHGHERPDFGTHAAADLPRLRGNPGG